MQHVVGMVFNCRYNWVLHDQTTSRSSVPKVWRSDHGRDPGIGSRSSKGSARKGKSRKRQAKERKEICFFKFGPDSMAPPQECVERSLKRMVDRRMYMQPFGDACTCDFRLLG